MLETVDKYAKIPSKYTAKKNNFEGILKLDGHCEGTPVSTTIRYGIPFDSSDLHRV